MGLLKVAGKVLKAGANLLGEKPKTEEEKKEVEFNLSTLDPKAQYLKSVARPVIAISLVGLFVLGILIQWTQQIFNAEYLISIPKEVITFAKIVVSAYIGSRGVEKVFDTLVGKK